jgi:hypothetical protein
MQKAAKCTDTPSSRFRKYVVENVNTDIMTMSVFFFGVTNEKVFKMRRR